MLAPEVRIPIHDTVALFADAVLFALSSMAQTLPLGYELMNDFIFWSYI
jgi:hypothetical protein